MHAYACNAHIPAFKHRFGCSKKTVIFSMVMLMMFLCFNPYYSLYITCTAATATGGLALSGVTSIFSASLILNDYTRFQIAHYFTMTTPALGCCTVCIPLKDVCAESSGVWKELPCMYLHYRHPRVSCFSTSKQLSSSFP